MVSTNLDVFLNRWFSTYEEARESLETHGGYLLPYKNTEVEQLRSELNSLRATTNALVQRLDALEQSAAKPRRK